MKAFMFSCLIIMLMACQKDTQTSNAGTEKPKVEDTSADIKNENITINKQQLIDKKIATSINKQRSVAINGEKYLTYATELITGSKVFNVLMKEYGKVKGTIVIVSSNEGIDRLKQKYPFKSAVNIAKDTFRVKPIDSKNLFGLYNDLKADKKVVQVELEIDFSGEQVKYQSY